MFIPPGLFSSKHVCSGKKCGRHVDEHLHESDNALHKFDLEFLNNVYRYTNCSFIFLGFVGFCFRGVSGSEFWFEFNVIVSLTKSFSKKNLGFSGDFAPFFTKIQSGPTFPHRG